MTNEIFIARRIDELPKVAATYRVFDSFGHGCNAYFDGSRWNEHDIHFWLDEVTIEQLIAEHPEVVEKIFEARKDKRGRKKGWKHSDETKKKISANSFNRKPNHQ